MRLDRVLSVVAGALAFGFAHAFVTGSWLRATLTPDPLVRPWFTNSTGSVLFTAAVVVFASFAMGVGARDRRAAITRGVSAGVGATVAMLAVIATMGGGTLGPIVFIVGGAVLIAAGASGGSIAAALKKD